MRSCIEGNCSEVELVGQLISRLYGFEDLDNSQILFSDSEKGNESSLLGHFFHPGIELTIVSLDGNYRRQKLHQRLTFSYHQHHMKQYLLKLLQKMKTFVWNVHFFFSNQNHRLVDLLCVESKNKLSTSLPPLHNDHWDDGYVMCIVKFTNILGTAKFSCYCFSNWKSWSIHSEI